MKNMLSKIPVGATLTLALLLTACGKQEAVGDVPSSEELAEQADAASQAIRDENADGDGDGQTGVDLAALSSYTNALRGFTIMVPDDWAVNEAASDDNGRTFKQGDDGARLAVKWVENREDAAWTKIVETVTDSDGGLKESPTGNNEYRAAGTLSNGRKSTQRMLRKPDGTMVHAEITYPADQADAIEPLARTILDSLTLQ